MAEKRKNEGDTASSSKKNKKAYKQPRQKGVLHAGMSGIIVTCQRNKEGQAVRELYSMLSEYIGENVNADEELEEDEEQTFEDAFNKELDQLRSVKPQAEKKLVSIPVEVECVVIMKTSPDIDPVQVILKIMHDVDATKRLKTRFCQRFVPVTKFCRAYNEDLEKCAKEVFAPHFHIPNQPAKKFMIVFNARNSNMLNRDEVINNLAKLVGEQHTVDLTSPDLTILVEVYTNVCGLSVVPDYNKYKRFNIQSIVNPTTGAPPKKKQMNETATQQDGVEAKQILDENTNKDED